MGEMNFYGGAGYGEPGEGEGFLGFGDDYRQVAATIGAATDPRSANQLQAISGKISTGAKTIETGAIQAEVFESIPEPQLKEMNRLKKLTGVDLTLHAPIVEPTGLSNQGWSEDARIEAERAMNLTVERGQKLDPDGNVVVTFHSSGGLPDTESKVKDPKTGEVRTTQLWIVNEDDPERQFHSIKPTKNPLLNKTPDAYEELDTFNKESWDRQVSHAAFQANQGKGHIENPLRELGVKESSEKLKDKSWLEWYYNSRTSEGQRMIKALSKEDQQLMKGAFDNISFGEAYTKDSYNEMQKLFNKAWNAAERNKDEAVMDKLNGFRGEMTDKMNNFKEDPTKLGEFSDAILQGVNILNSIEAPKSFRPMKDFAIDKSSESFSNVAYNAYKKFGKHAPIISIENPPAGSGLSRAEDLRELITETREKFAQKAVKDGLSESDAKEQAEKLIGATWDIGHINMIRKFGFDEKDIIKETEQIAPFVKHVHLSDNFGLEHTELPMGMGNVPTKEHMELIGKYNKEAKKIIEAGNWYQHFKTTPLTETFKAFGSPIYAMKAGPYWNQAAAGLSGGYFAGYGQTLPEHHFNMYGAGFSNLPLELGGQGAGKSRMSGTPME